MISSQTDRHRPEAQPALDVKLQWKGVECGLVGGVALWSESDGLGGGCEVQGTSGELQVVALKRDVSCQTRLGQSAERVTQQPGER